jgi:hypothetical protein
MRNGHNSSGFWGHQNSWKSFSGTGERTYSLRDSIIGGEECCDCTYILVIVMCKI